MNDENEKIINTTDGEGGEMTDNSRQDLKEIVKVYYGKPTLTPEEAEEVEQLLSKIEASGFKERCCEIAKKQEKKYWHIGKLTLSRVACIIGIICCFTLLSGFTVYSVYIKNLRMENKGDHEEIRYTFDKNADVKSPKTIETYYDPVWVPEGYHIEWAIKHEKRYSVQYVSDDEDSDYSISYEQLLPGLNPHLSTENGSHEEVTFGKYYGEYVDTDNGNFLIVTDGVYVYILISDEDINKDDLIRMIY